MKIDISRVRDPKKRESIKKMICEINRKLKKSGGCNLPKMDTKEEYDAYAKFA